MRGPSDNRRTSSAIRGLFRPLCLWARGVALALLLAPAAHAFDLSGSLSYFLTSLDNRGLESDLTQQQASLGLFQELTPYVSMRLGLTYLDYQTEGEQGDFTRRFSEPQLDLLYNRERLSGRLQLRDRTADGTFDADNFEARSLLANVSWRPRRGPGFLVGYRDESNVADEAVFGRDVTSRSLNLETFYNGSFWGASYSFQNTRIANAETGFDSDQDRHEVRARIGQRFADDRLSFDLTSSVSRLDRRSVAGEGAGLGEPVASLEGLFAVDTSPEVGELVPAPGLVDGDRDTPVSPEIDIGGGSTFRNIGLSLPVVSPVSRLEISVDTLSGSAVVWQVYQSPDNLSWAPVPGVTATFDGALLRYTLRFPEVQNRFFKAVNVSLNPEPIVRVTEIRALRDRAVTSDEEAFESTLYRADLRVDFRPTSRVSAGVNFGLSSDEDLAAGLVRRDFEETHGGARLGVDLHPDLRLSFAYRYTDSEDLREPRLLRRVDTLSGSLAWTPLPTLDALLSVQEREESEESVVLQSLRSTRLVVSADLLADLRLVTDLEASELDSPFAGTTRDGWTWTERLEARPTQRWTLGGGYRFSRYETFDGEPLFEFTEIDVSTTWIATNYLTFNGAWAITDEADRDSVRQNYNLSYGPGPKLLVSAAYQEFSTDVERVTATGALSVSYRLHDHVLVFANLTRSEFGEGGGAADRVTSLRTGLRLFF